VCRYDDRACGVGNRRVSLAGERVVPDDVAVGADGDD
jgi:hypothetical protein